MATKVQVQTEAVAHPSVQVRVEADEHEILAGLSDKIPLPRSSTDQTQILSIDKNTPDGHIARDPRLLRLTGAHPFNSEPPLTELYKQGNGRLSRFMTAVRHKSLTRTGPFFDLKVF